MLRIYNKKERNKKIYSVLALTFLLIASVSVFIPQAKATTYGTFNFAGPLDEINPSSMLVFSQNISVVAHVASGGAANPDFTFNTAYTFTDTAGPIQYFTYDWNETGTNQHREYWLDSADNTTGGTYNCYFDTVGLTNYVISFLDYAGTLKSYPFVEAQVDISGTYHTVEKRVVDNQNIVVMSLRVGSSYQIVFGDNAGNKIVYGDLTTTASTGIQLVIRDLVIPATFKALYTDAYAYSVRQPNGNIIVSYLDVLNKTNSLNITITEALTNVVAFTQVFSPINGSYIYTWTSAVNATSYEVTVTIDHQTFGVFHYDQYLAGEYSTTSDPFSLDFLGTIGINTAWFIPALLIIFVAGCFSELTAETASILTVIVAIILTYMGWISISSTVLVTALSLSFLAAVVTARRRFF